MAKNSNVFKSEKHMKELCGSKHNCLEKTGEGTITLGSWLDIKFYETNAPLKYPSNCPTLNLRDDNNSTLHDPFP